jgi:site-specific DNA-methyltransferase (adenine-specific)
MLELNHLYNLDCMEGMKDFPDKFFDLAIVDPPYNVGASDGMFGAGPGRGYRPDLKHYTNHDETPGQNYFNEIFRISKNQIIWGSNYYPQYLYHSGAIIWYKKEHGPLSDAEIAFQSFSKIVSVYKHNWSGFVKESSDKDIIRIHPNQKPIALYKWLLKNYAKPDFKIIDTHAGSCSSVIAFEDFGCQWIAFEIDKDYYQSALKRIENHKLQLKLAI